MVVVLSPTALSKGVLLLLSVHYVERNATFFKNEMGDFSLGAHICTYLSITLHNSSPAPGRIYCADEVMGESASRYYFYNIYI